MEVFLMEDLDLEAVIEAAVDDAPSPIVGEHVMRIVNKALAAERASIRRELYDWLVGDIDPRDAGLYNSRRIVDEINRICPKEG